MVFLAFAIMALIIIYFVVEAVMMARSQDVNPTGKMVMILVCAIGLVVCIILPMI